MFRNFRLVVLVLVTLIGLTIFGTVYAVAQQTIRQSQNEQLTQLVDAYAYDLQGSVKAASLFGKDLKVDLNTTHEPFVVVYDKSGNVLGTNAQLDNGAPVVPKGVLTSTQVGKYHTVTWQPDKGLRFATVTTATDKYYVLAGRSLQGPEKLIERLALISVAGLVAFIVVTFGGYWLLTMRNRKAGAVTA